MDSICVRSGLHGLGSSVPLNNGLEVFRPNPSVSSVGRSPAPIKNAISVDKTAASSTSMVSKFASLHYPFRSLFHGGDRKQRSKGVALDDTVLVEEENKVGCSSSDLEGHNGNWVMKFLHVRSLWQGKENGGPNGNFEKSSSFCCDGDEGCKVCDDDGIDDDDDDDKEQGENVEFDRNSFFKMLKKVSLSEAKLYAQMSYLGSLAYCIPSIKV